MEPREGAGCSCSTSSTLSGADGRVTCSRVVNGGRRRRACSRENDNQHLHTAVTKIPSNQACAVVRGAGGANLVSKRDRKEVPCRTHLRCVTRHWSARRAAKPASGNARKSYRNFIIFGGSVTAGSLQRCAAVYRNRDGGCHDMMRHGTPYSKAQSRSKDRIHASTSSRIHSTRTAG